MELKKLRKTISEKGFSLYDDIKIRELIDWLKAADLHREKIDKINFIKAKKIYEGFKNKYE